jgi:hypothetical protein
MNLIKKQCFNYNFKFIIKNNFLNVHVSSINTLKFIFL